MHRQAGIGRVDLTAYHSFKKALESGRPADFEAIPLGGIRTLNGPQGGLAFDLEGLDSSQFAPPPAPALASEAYAAELVELYWASLLRDVAFTDYGANPIAAQAAGELSSLSNVCGPRDASNQVTPQTLFRAPAAGAIQPRFCKCRTESAPACRLCPSLRHICTTAVGWLLTLILTFFTRHT
jgi:hypothetical protein